MRCASRCLTGTLYYLHSDHLGSVSAITDLSGSVIVIGDRR